MRRLPSGSTATDCAVTAIAVPLVRADVTVLAVALSVLTSGTHPASHTLSPHNHVHNKHTSYTYTHDAPKNSGASGNASSDAAAPALAP
jgi:hypothetical protein